MNKNFVLPFLLLSVVSCVNYSYSPDIVSRSDAQKQQYVVLGTIIDITSVTIEGDREKGAVAGALIGGAAGKSVTDSEYLEPIFTYPNTTFSDQRVFYS